MARPPGYVQDFGERVFSKKEVFAFGKDKGLRISPKVFKQLNNLIVAALSSAAESAQDEKRTTMMDRDLSSLMIVDKQLFVGYMEWMKEQNNA